MRRTGAMEAEADEKSQAKTSRKSTTMLKFVTTTEELRMTESGSITPREDTGAPALMWRGGDDAPHLSERTGAIWHDDTRAVPGTETHKDPT